MGPSGVTGRTDQGGDSYTLTLTSHDDGWPGDATYTLFDDVAVTPAPVSFGSVSSLCQ